MALNIIPKQYKAVFNITVGAFYQRLGSKHPELLALADNLAVTGDYSLKADLMRIDRLEFINLTDESLRAGLVKTAIFTDDELENIFAAGQAEEVPESLKA